MKRPSCAAILAVLVLAGPARADEGDELAFSAELVDTTYLRMKVKALQFKGKVANFPDGTQIDIRFKIRENRQHIAWYKTLITKEAIQGQQVYRKKAFPPAVYNVEFWFQMQTQTPGMRNWFRTNRGWTSNYRELLDTVEIKVGDDAARARTLEECTRKIAKMFAPIQDFGKAMKAHLDKLQGLSEADKEQAHRDWMAGPHKQWYARLGELQLEEYEWAKRSVALPAEEGRLQLKTAISQALTLLAVNKDRRPTVNASYKHLETSLRQLDDLLSAEKEIDIGRSKPDKGAKKEGE